MHEFNTVLYVHVNGNEEITFPYDKLWAHAQFKKIIPAYNPFYIILDSILERILKHLITW